MASSTSSVITLKINGEKHTLPVDHRTTLLDRAARASST